MTNLRIKFKPGAKFKLRNAPGVQKFLEAAGSTLMDDANDTLDEGEGYRMSSSKGINWPYGRWQVNVYTSSDHAKRSNAKHNTLLRLLN
jgi:hypothetical protein